MIVCPHSWPNVCEELAKAEADIELLLAESLQTEQNWAADWKHEFDKLRDETIEECARVVEAHPDGGTQYVEVTKQVLANTIRALKEKT